MELRGYDSVRWPCWEECLVAGRDCNILEWDIGEMVQMMIISVLDNPFCDPAVKILKWDLSMKFEVTRSVFMRMKSACMNFVSALVFLLNVIFTFICLLYKRCTQHVGSTFLFIVAVLIKVFTGRDIGLSGAVTDSHDSGLNVDVIIDSVYKHYKNMWCWKVWVDEPDSAVVWSVLLREGRDYTSRGEKSCPTIYLLGRLQCKSWSIWVWTRRAILFQH